MRIFKYINRMVVSALVLAVHQALGLRKAQ